MATSILRFEKVKSFTAINLSESHVYRFSYTPNATPERTQFNKVLIGKSGLSTRIKKVFNKLGIKPRKNAVLAMDCILSLSNDAFDNKEDIDRFCDASKKFLEETFKGRCVSAVIHLDESTPHIHALILPLEKKDGKWKLNARKIFNKTTLSRYQKEFYFSMKNSFPSLIPPQYGRKASHKSIKKYYNSIGLHLDRTDELSDNIKDIYSYDTTENSIKNNQLVKISRKLEP
ncbi:MobV family relaxase [Vibrio parahaemolyticus]|uniref:MobV family relaxase n=1 Tax=Vibrio parahaemolyticus TaxID=670 RepID=UPI0009B0B04F|nr:MobV family relaxase [Vibrio parahaemolyticus]